ncbi:MAG: TonB-dependent receptor [Pseudomonadota bacterium]
MHAHHMALALAGLAAFPASALAQEHAIIVNGKHKIIQEQTPASIVSHSAEDIERTTNVINTEDALRYYPNILVRKRHVGDTQAPISTRTSGVGASARSLIYADGVLVSALIGNNNSNASPKWGMIAPDEIAGIDVLYGPFSAAYPGNSIGAVVNIATRMPEKFEGSLSSSGSLQHFHQYITKDDFGAHQFAATFGDRFGPFSFWLSAQQTQSDSQPLAYATATRPAAPSAAGTPLTGAFTDLNRTGAPIAVLGAAGFEGQTQDNLKLKLAWDFTPQTHLMFTLGRFGNDTKSTVQSYLRNAAGDTVYAGGPFNIGGYNYTVAATTFSNNVYAFDEAQWMRSLSLDHSGDTIDWRIVASDYNYEKSEQRTPSTALPGAFSGGAGSITRFDGTGWRTLDGKLVWRGIDAHEISFGAHGDEYELANNRFNTTDWLSGPAGALASAARGKTRTYAAWVQDAWRIGDAFKLTTGARFESWQARDGLNYSLSPALNVAQPTRGADKLSPKATLEWSFAPDWKARASFGRAYRFPTVGELYQAITTGATLTSPNPNLRPERALSTEWAIERMTGSGSLRASLFTEDLSDALISQTAPLVPGSTTLFSYVQNIDKVRSRGVEFVAEQNDVLIHGLSLSGSLTYVDSEIARDAAFRAAEGKQAPQVPRWRATAVATWRPDEKWAFTVAGRYSDRVYATIDNTDPVTHTYQGFDDYLVFDVRAALALNAHWSAAVGIENIGGEDYYIFHPFPQRTATAELKYRF